MSEISGTYDCGVTCACDAVTDLATERTELMEEMAAALEESVAAIEATWFRSISEGAHRAAAMKLLRAHFKARTVLAKYRGEEGHHAGR